MKKTLTCFADDNAVPTFDQPRPDRLLSGHSPQRTTCAHYADTGVSAGVWSCEPGAWRIAFAPHTDEFFHVIAGRIRITDADGLAREFGPGDACVIPGGFTGQFEVLEAVKKHYVFIERDAFSTAP